MRTGGVTFSSLLVLRCNIHLPMHTMAVFTYPLNSLYFISFNRHKSGQITFQ